MKSLITASLLLTIIFISCKSENKKNIADTTQNNSELKLPVEDYIKRFKLLQLPFFVCNGNIDRNHLFVLNQNSIDTLFYNFKNVDKVYGYGILVDTTNYYSLIYFGVADDLFPILCTYSKSGKLIKKEILGVGGCGTDCGMTYCSSSALIRKDYSIYLADTSKYQGICDSVGNYLPNSDSTFIISRIGVIDRKGQIKFEKEKRESFKNKP